MYPAIGTLKLKRALAVAGRWGLLLLCVCVASLAGNVYLYLELKSATSIAPPPVSLAPPEPPADRSARASAGTAAVQTVKRQTPEQARASAAETRPAKSIEECTRIRLEHNRAELRDPAQRQQTKENYISYTRQEAESYGGLDELHLSEEQLNRLYELAAEWLVQSAETYPPPRSNWPLEHNPLIAAELGTEVAEKWAKYQRESNGRFQVRQLAGLLSTMDVPLTTDQRRQMIELYAALDEERWTEVREKAVQSPTSEAEAVEMHHGTRERNVHYRQKLLDRAASILSARQLDILRRDSEQGAAGMERAWEYTRSQGKLIQIDADGCVRSYMP